MATVKIGDIIEIETAKGFFYAQYTHKDKTYGDLIQVTKNSFPERPGDLEEVISDDVGIITFFPLNIAVRRKIFSVIGNRPVPEKRRQFPLFRVRGYIDRSGTVRQWKFWDGQKTWPEQWLTELTDKEMELPIEGIWNDTLLIDRLETGWMPREYAGNH